MLVSEKIFNGERVMYLQHLRFFPIIQSSWLGWQSVCSCVTFYFRPRRWVENGEPRSYVTSSLIGWAQCKNHLMKTTTYSWMNDLGMGGWVDKFQQKCLVHIMHHARISGWRMHDFRKHSASQTVLLKTCRDCSYGSFTVRNGTTSI